MSVEVVSRDNMRRISRRSNERPSLQPAAGEPVRAVVSVSIFFRRNPFTFLMPLIF